MPRRTERVLLLSSLLLVGASGVLLALGWVRLATLTFGAVPLTRGAALAAILASMALGSFLSARPAFARFHPARSLAALAVATGVAGFFSTLSAAGGMIAAVAFSTALGAMLPTAVRAVDPKNVGAVFAVFTLGAAVAPSAAVFVFFPLLGVHRTLALAAGAAALTGAGLVAIQTSLQFQDVRTGETLRARRPDLILVGALVLTGAVLAILEVGWARVLSLVLPATVYTTAVRMSAFLLALSGGSAITGALLKRGRDVSTASVAWLATLAAVFSLLSLFVAKTLPPLVVEWHRSLPQGETSLFALPLLISTLLMLPGAFALSAALPLATAASTHGPVAVRTSYLLGAGLAGAAAGALTGRGLLIGTLGIETSVRVATLFLFAFAVALFFLCRRWMGAIVSTTIAILVLGLEPSWESVAKSFGLYSDPALYARDPARLREQMRSYTPLFYKDGATATIAVHAVEKYRLLKVNGKTEASNAPEDMEADVLLAQLPLMALPARRVAVLGWGGGVTVDAVLSHDVESVRAFEIEPAVVEASSHFVRAGKNPADDPRVILVRGDPRSSLEQVDATFDVILSSPGAPSLYTAELYRIAASRLAPSGILAQRAPLGGVSEDAFRALLRTFRSAFPHVVLWRSRGAILIGSRERIRFDLERMKSLFAREAVAESLSRVFVRYPADLLVDLRAGDRGVAAFASTGRLNTDDNLLLALTTPPTMYQDQTEAILREVAAPFLWEHVTGYNDRASVELEIAASYFTKGRKEQALAVCESALSARKSFEGQKLKGQILDGLGRTKEARAALESALRLGGDPEGRRFVEALLRALENRTGTS